MDGMRAALMYNCNYGGHPTDDPTHHLNLSAIPDVRRISARTITGTNTRTIGDLEGLAQDPMADITFADIHFDGGSWQCNKEVSGTYSNVVPKPCSAISPV